MPQLIKPNTIITKEVTSRDGEFTMHITLDLNINVNGGNVEVSAHQSNSKKEKNEDDEVQLLIPQFTSGQKIKFGKKE